MKTYSCLIFLGIASLVMPLTAADFVVDDQGTYQTIQAAIDAASAGDRIFVKNKSGNIPYGQDVTINKPIELLPFTEDGKFYVTGNYTISPNTTHFSVSQNEVRIIGMVNTQGNIESSGNASGIMVRVSALNCEFTDGDYSIYGTDFDSVVANCIFLEGSVKISQGYVTGNSITLSDTSGVSNPVLVVEGGGATQVRDATYILGNRIISETGDNDNQFGYIELQSLVSAVVISNNYIRSNAGRLVNIAQLYTSGVVNVISNNTFESTYESPNHRGIEVDSINAAGALQIISNAIYKQVNNPASTDDIAIYIGSGNTGAVEIGYNVYGGWLGGLFNTGGQNAVASLLGNTESSSVAIDQTTGVCTGSGAVNTGHPGNEHFDLDLTRNDRGVAGGSFSYTNFWPNQTGASRIYFMDVPRVVAPSSSVSGIEAEGFDN